MVDWNEQRPSEDPRTSEWPGGLNPKAKLRIEEPSAPLEFTEIATPRGGVKIADHDNGVTLAVEPLCERAM